MTFLCIIPNRLPFLPLKGSYLQDLVILLKGLQRLFVLVQGQQKDSPLAVGFGGLILQRVFEGALT